MIATCKSSETEQLYEGEDVRRFRGIKKQALTRRRRLDAAEALQDLAAIPGNHLEILKGNRKGQHSIRINDQWRICFRWIDGRAYDVEIVDYDQDSDSPW